MYKRFQKKLVICLTITVIFSAFVTAIASKDINSEKDAGLKRALIRRELAVERFNDNPFERHNPEVQKQLRKQYSELIRFKRIENEDIAKMNTRNNDHISYQFHFPNQTRAQLLTESIIDQRVASDFTIEIEQIQEAKHLNK